MGVHGLWELLAPVGRRVSVETLAGKKLAIDASIWMVQFMKAMRDEQGEMVRNAHLIGFFRRICKLLFLRTKPVFVFDGGTPALKRRTVVARRKQRENAQAKIRKTAEKLLLNHLKSMKLKELAEDIKKQKQMTDAKGKKVLSAADTEMPGNSAKANCGLVKGHDQENLDQMLAASLAAEEEWRSTEIATTSNVLVSSDENDEVEEMILPGTTEKVDPAVLEALPPDILAQMRGRLDGADYQHYSEVGKDEQQLSSQINTMRMEKHDKSVCHGQEKLDEMLAASIVAEEGGGTEYSASTSAAQIFSEDEDIDADEEMIVPEVHGNIDRDVLNSLPISVRLDLFAQMKERQMTENRQKYQQVKKAPEQFSELQIQSYLKAIALRREINQVQKAAVGNGVGGVQTSRIASEANRKFIFSSSFTGSKELLTATDSQRNNGREETRIGHPSSSFDIGVSLNSKSNASTESAPSKSKSCFRDSVETFLDERRRIRVSRSRAMGIRMTRDLQRNLDMMKEIEQDLIDFNSHSRRITNPVSAANTNDGGILRTDLVAETLHDHHVAGPANSSESNGLSVPAVGTCIQISFQDNSENNCLDEDAELFTRLAAGESVTLPSGEKITSGKHSSNVSSDFEQHEWKGDSFSHYVQANVLKEGKASEDSEVEWEEGYSDVSKDSSACPVESRKMLSIGQLEEDADLQEAIRRSIKDQKSHNDESVMDGEKRHGEYVICDLQKSLVEQTISDGHASQDTERDHISINNIADGSPKWNCTAQAAGSLENAEKTPIPCKLDNARMPMSGVDGTLGGSSVEWSEKHDFHACNFSSENPLLELTPLETKRGLSVEPLDTTDASFGVDSSADGRSGDSLCTSDQVCTGISGSNRIDDDKKHAEAVLIPPISEKTDLATDGPLSAKEELTRDIAQEQTVGSSHGDDSSRRLQNLSRFCTSDHENERLEIAEDNLEDEMLKLGEESLKLGEVQRKLERNAESVSSEMFAECQELLQMFGLPYIIAPMEAEAQCAYMELANLVDGVVTDDSDVFLFGARSVYKNIFDDRKYVETYFMKDLEKELGLTRDKLIRMAMLLGSDYTEGVSGIGIVNAIEVVNAFPEEDGLQKFREWVESPDPTILGKVDMTSTSTVGRRQKVSNNSIDCHGGTEQEATPSEQNISQPFEQGRCIDQIEEMKQEFMEKHRRVSKNWHIPPTFPSEAVMSAYSAPQVDKSTDPFSWGKPDLFLLRKLCWEKFGWGSQKADELLVPVLNEYSKHETQLRLEAFYSFNERFAKIRSKRIKKAVKEITGSQSLELMDDDRQSMHGSRKKSRGISGNVTEEKSECASPETGRNHYSTSTKRSPKQSRKRRIQGKPILSEVENFEVSKLMESGEYPSKRILATRADGGRGRGKGHRATRRGQKASHNASCHSSRDSDSDCGGHESQAEECNKLREVRRSKRQRKQVYESLGDLEDNSPEHNCDKNYEEEASDFNSLSGSVCRNAEALNAKRQLTPGNSCLAEESPSTDYLQMGGGFCLDETNTGEPQQRPYTPSEHISEDYGGGICMHDEAKMSKNTGSPSDIVADTLMKGSEPCQNVEPAEKAEFDNCTGQSICNDKISSTVSFSEASSVQEDVDSQKVTPDVRSFGNVAQEEDRSEDLCRVSYGSLSAMPTLKRKRRRS